MKIIVTGSEGLLGNEISQYLEKNNEVIRLDIKLGHELTNEEFVIEFFKNNKADCLVNCFAFNDHVKKGEKRGTIFDITLESFNEFLEINLTALFSVCRQFAKNNQKVLLIFLSENKALLQT